MATYHFSAVAISRSKGQSVVASAAYRAGVALEDERIGKTFDYERRRGVLHAEILTPGNTPDWMRDRAQLWNAVEAVEKRKDAQLARHVELALPHELTQAQRIDLVREFVREEFIGKGMIADVAIHAPDREGDQRNYHAHILLTMRALIPADAGTFGFGKKAREWNSTDQLEHWRESWANHVNRTLEREGIEARVDHRTLAEQGITREPEMHLGWAATEQERQGQETDRGDELRGIRERNEERARLVAELRAAELELAAEQARAATEIEQARQQEEARQSAARAAREIARPQSAPERPLGNVTAASVGSQAERERKEADRQAQRETTDPAWKSARRVHTARAVARDLASMAPAATRAAVHEVPRATRQVGRIAGGFARGLNKLAEIAGGLGDFFALRAPKHPEQQRQEARDIAQIRDERAETGAAAHKAESDRTRALREFEAKYRGDEELEQARQRAARDRGSGGRERER